MDSTRAGPPALDVAIDATPLLGARSGVGVFAAELVERLARRSAVDLTAFAVSARGGNRLRAALPPGVRTSMARRLPASLAHRLWAYSRWPTAEQLIGRHEVVHGTNFVAPPTRAAASVVTVHDLTPLRFPELATPATRRYPALVRRAATAGAWIHTPSAFVAREVVAELDISPERVVAVAHGIPDLGPAEPGAGRATAGADHYVLALGTVEPRKALPDLVQAFDRIAPTQPSLWLVIAGADGWGAEELQRAVDAAEHRDRIRRLGRVSDGEAASLLADAALLAYPSTYEGFGFPPLQAMRVGTPVVAAAAGAIPEVVGPAARLVPPGDVDALADALFDVLTDDQVREDLAAAGHRRVRDFSWDRCADEMVELYRAAAASR